MNIDHDAITGENYDRVKFEELYFGGRFTAEMLSFEDVNAVAMANWGDVLHSLGLYDDGKLEGVNYSMLNHKRGDSKLGSFKFNTEKGVWKDFADDKVSGSDLISLVAYMRSWNMYQAKEWLAKVLRMTDETLDETIPETKLSKSVPSAKTKPKTSDEWVWIEEVPLHAIQMVEHWEKNFPPNQRNWKGQVVTKLTAYPYRNQHGKISSYVIRYDHPDGEKTPVPYSYLKHKQHGWEELKPKAPPQPYTVFNLDQLYSRSDAPVLVVEGEKAAVAATALFPDHVVVTTRFGANNPLRSNLIPLVGKKLLFWPDHDDKGLHYIHLIAQYLRSNGHTLPMHVLGGLRFLPVIDDQGQVMLSPMDTDLPEGWDAADAVQVGWTKAHIDQLPAANFVEFVIPTEQAPLPTPARVESTAQPAPQEAPSKEKQLPQLVLPAKGKWANWVNQFVTHEFPNGLININSMFYSYREGYWKLLHDVVDVFKPLLAFMTARDGIHSGNEHRTVMSHLGIACAQPDKFSERVGSYICLRNGTLDMTSFQLVSHSYAHFLRNRLDLHWDDNAQCPRWIQFMAEIFADDTDRDEKIQFLQEWMGYCLVTDNTQHKFVLLVGDGGNGKSVLLEILQYLVGRENVSNALFERLGDKFVRAELEGKLINISSEMSAEATVSDGYLKAIVAGDSLEAERKHKPSFSFKPFVKLIGATNHLPRLLDLSEGFMRRIVILQFNRKFTNEERNPNLVAELQLEAAGILKWAVDGYRRLQGRKRFIIPSSSKEAVTRYVGDSDVVGMFARSMLIRATEPIIRTSDLYSEYREWSLRNGFRPSAVNSFSARMAQLGFTKSRQRNGMYWNCTCRTQFEEDDYQ